MIALLHPSQWERPINFGAAVRTVVIDGRSYEIDLNNLTEWSKREFGDGYLVWLLEHSISLEKLLKEYRT